MCNTILFCLFNIYIFARHGSQVGENILHTLCETSAKWVKVKESHYKCLMRYSFILDIDFPRAQSQDPKFRFFFFLHCDTFFCICMLSESIFQTHFIALDISEKEKKKIENEGLVDPHLRALHQSASSIMRNLHFRRQKEKKQTKHKNTKKKKKGILIQVFYAFCKTYWSKIAVGFFYLRYEIRNFVYC